MKHHRLARVAEAIREVASETILFELRDPRIKFTTVTRAEVSADLQHAKVYVSVMGSDRERTLTLHGLRERGRVHPVEARRPDEDPLTSPSSSSSSTRGSRTAWK